MPNLTYREQFIVLVDSERAEKADAIILLTGDGFFRVQKAKELLGQGFADTIVVSGGMHQPENGSLPAVDIKERLLQEGVLEDQVILESSSQNTKEQAEEVMHIAREKKWRRLLLVASHYHHYRAFLTFLKVVLETDRNIYIVSTPARNLKWFEDTPWGKRSDLLKREFEKIETYQKSGHLASFKEAIEYQEWKEKQQEQHGD